jgi:hypothetical protein
LIFKKNIHKFKFLPSLTSGYTIIWHNREIPVFRPDVECINGIIHVIDHPLLEESDVRAASVNGATTTTTFVLNSILVNLLMTLLARLFV